jgi:hypothetical protein
MGNTWPCKGRTHTGSTKELAVKFLMYGTLAEIFARETGFNKGLGGSMHAFFTPFGVYPNNAIVGGSGDISVGAALYTKSEPQERYSCGQHWRCIDGMRPGMGRACLCHHGPVQLNCGKVI